MLFRKSYQMPCRKLIPPFTFTHKKKNAFVRFAHARAFFIFVHFTAVLVLSTTWNDLFYSCVDDASTWPKCFKFLFSNLKHSWQFNPGRKVSKHFASQTTWNNREIITENRSYIAPLDVGNKRKRKNQKLRCFMKSYFIKLIISSCDKLTIIIQKRLIIRETSEIE